MNRSKLFSLISYYSTTYNSRNNRVNEKSINTNLKSPNNYLPTKNNIHKFIKVYYNHVHDDLFLKRFTLKNCPICSVVGNDAIIDPYLSKVEGCSSFVSYEKGIFYCKSCKNNSNWAGFVENTIKCFEKENKTLKQNNYDTLQIKNVENSSVMFNIKIKKEIMNCFDLLKVETLTNKYSNLEISRFYQIVSPLMNNSISKVDKYKKLLTLETLTLFKVFKLVDNNNKFRSLFDSTKSHNSQINKENFDNKVSIAFPLINIHDTENHIYYVDKVKILTNENIEDISRQSRHLYLPIETTQENKKLTDEAYFGFNTVLDKCRRKTSSNDKSDKSLVITSNELDAMCIYQDTKIPTIVLNNFNEESLIRLGHKLKDNFERIILWLGTLDYANHKQIFSNIENFMESNSIECFNVKLSFSEDYYKKTPFSLFSQGQNLTKYINNAMKINDNNSNNINDSALSSFKQYEDMVRIEILNHEKMNGIPSRNFKRLNTIMGGLRYGEMTIFTGTTGSGKTTFLSQLSLDYCANSNVPTLWGSFEIPTVRLIRKMMNQHFEKRMDMYSSSFQEYSNTFEKLPLHFMNYFGATKLEKILSTMKRAVERYDVQHVVLDNLQFMTYGLAKGFEKWELQDQVINELRKFTYEHNVHVTVVVHPKKEENQCLTINSIFGSAKITQDADNVIILQKAHDNKYRFIDIKKNRDEQARRTKNCKRTSEPNYK